VLNADGPWYLNANSWSFNNPSYAWWVNGTRLPAKTTGESGDSVDGLLAMTTTPEPGGEKAQLRMLNLRAETDPASSQLRLHTDPGDGNYLLTITVRVAEAAAPEEFLASATTDLEVENVVVNMGGDYDRAVTECAKKFQDVNDEYAISRGWHRVDVSAAVSRNAAVLTAWAEEVTSVAPGLGGLAAQAAKVLTNKQRFEAVQKARLRYP
jgi:hypothetical protein